MSAPIDDGSTHLHLGITVKPLFSQHGDERGEEGSGQTGVEDGLDVDDGGIGTTPLRKIDSGTIWDISNTGVGDDLEEVETQFRKIRL